MSFNISNCDSRTIDLLNDLRSKDYNFSDSELIETTAHVMENMDEEHRSEFFGNHKDTYKIVNALIKVMKNDNEFNRDDLIETMKHVATDYYWQTIEELSKDAKHEYKGLY